MTAIKFASRPPLAYRPRSKSFIGSYYRCRVQTLKLNKNKLETKTETFVWITVLLDCLWGILFQMGIFYCLCRIVVRVGNLTPQP